MRAGLMAASPTPASGALIAQSRSHSGIMQMSQGSFRRPTPAARDHARHSHTIIMVAHRLTTLNENDCIFVFDQGRVVEQGAFDQLVEKNGVFAELIRSAEAA